MDNRRIAESLDLLADLLEIQGANPFRVRAHRQAAQVIRDLPENVVERLHDVDRPLSDLPGIGKDLAGKIQELATTGNLAQLQEIQQQIPLTVLELSRVPGLGPKKAATLFRELGVTNLDELRAACDDGRVAQLKGFGTKSSQAIRQGLEQAAAAAQRLRWDEADQIVQDLRAYLSPLPAIDRLELAGSYRRGKDTVGDLDLLVTTDSADTVMSHLASFADVTDILARGETKMSIRVRSGLQVDLRCVPATSFGAAWQYFTGSQEHNVTLRSRAKEAGLKLNEYGLFRSHPDGTETLVAGETEAEVYAALGLPWIPPELRENRLEFHWAESAELPELIQLADIRGDLHMHTVATDGSASIESMALAAQARGWEYIAITDHSQRVTMARGLDPVRLREQWREIDRINQSWSGDFRVLKGIECDILEKGGMDLPDDVLAEADWVLASIHYGQQQSREQLTERLLMALVHPYVSAIAHPTGRLLGQRPAYDVDMAAVLQCAAAQGKAMELNANPRRLDLNDVHCATARTLHIPIVINSDAHAPEGMDVMRFGIMQARRGGLTRGHVLNALPWRELQPRLAALRRPSQAP